MLVFTEKSFLDCLTTKKFQDFSKISAKFQEFPGLVGTMHIETSPLIFSSNQWTGFYKIGTFVMEVFTSI